MSLVENIKSLCSKIGTSIPKLEKQLGLSRGSIYNWDKNSPSIDKLEKVANFFKVSVDYLLDRGDIFDLGPYIEEERHEQGISEREFSNQLDINEFELSEYEDQIKPITLGLVEKAMNIFDLTYPEFLDKYGLLDIQVPSYFNGDVNAYLKFEEAKYQDAMRDKGDDIETLAARHDAEEWTGEELSEIERFKLFIKSKRNIKE